MSLKLGTTTTAQGTAPPPPPPFSPYVRPTTPARPHPLSPPYSSHTPRARRSLELLRRLLQLRPSWGIY
jgi:hypothetical protein